MAPSFGRLRRIAGLDILPVKPYQGWDDLQIDEALGRPELFRGNRELYAAVRREAIKRGLGGEEDYAANPFRWTDMAGEQQVVAETGLPSLLKDPQTRQERAERKRTRKNRGKERKERLRRLLVDTTAPLAESGKRVSAFDRLLRLAAAVGDAGADTAAIDGQLGLYLRREIERWAHMVPSENTDTPDTPPMWRHNMDYTPEENSPYFGSAAEFMKRFPGGIADWRKWRDRSRKRRERQWKLSAMLENMDKTASFESIAENDSLETFLREAWKQESGSIALAHYVPEGGDDVANLGDKEPKIWSDEPKWESIGEFLKAHREHYGQDADDAALKAARDFVKYWKLTTRKSKGLGKK